MSYQLGNKDLSGQIRMLKPNSIALGGFSDVYLGEWTNPTTGAKQVVAIKVLRGPHMRGSELFDKLAQRLKRESGLWRQFDHPNVLPFLGLAVDNVLGPLPALISPFCSKGSILEAIKKDPTIERLPIILGIAKGLQYLHQNEAIHGDLKAENVLMSDDGQPLLSDFGRSKLIARRGYTTEFACAYRYLAPEVMDTRLEADGTQGPPRTTKQTDVYSFSLIGVEVLSGMPAYPKFKQDFQVLHYVAQGGQPKIEDYSDSVLPPEAPMVWRVLELCWVRDPEQRPTMVDILSDLSSIVPSTLPIVVN